MVAIKTFEFFQLQLLLIYLIMIISPFLKLQLYPVMIYNLVKFFVHFLQHCSEIILKKQGLIIQNLSLMDVLLGKYLIKLMILTILLWHLNVQKQLLELDLLNHLLVQRLPKHQLLILFQLRQFFIVMLLNQQIKQANIQQQKEFFLIMLILMNKLE